MNELSPADLAALMRGNGEDGGFGGNNGAIWLLIIIILFGGWGGNRGWGGNGGSGAGSVGGNELYPWLNNSNQINDGFRDQMLNTTITGIQNDVTTGFANVQQSLCSGFAGVAQGFSQTQMGMMQGFNGVQAQLAECCCENRLATANQTAALLAEHCADRAAVSDGIRDIITNQTANTQRILDKLCDQELQAERRENDNLRQQLYMKDLAASQIAQTATIQAGQVAEVDALYQRLRDCPVGTMPVYGNQPIFTCPGSNGCGCNG